MFRSFFAPLDSLLTRQDRCYMPAADATSWDPMIKDTYHSRAMLNTLNEENPALDFMEEVEATPTQGRKHVIPKIIGRNYSAGSIPIRGALPQQDRAKFTKSEIDVRNIMVRVGFDEWVEQRTRNNKGAFAEAFATEMDVAIDSVAFQRNRMAWGTGRGVLAKVNGTHAGLTTIELKDPGGVAGTFMANRYVQGDANGGMYLGFLDGSTFAIKGTAQVTAVNADGTDITVDGAQVLADGDLVVIAQSPSQTSYDVEPEGILAAVDDGTYVATYHAIVRSSTPIEKAHVVTGVGPISYDAIQQGEDACSIRVGGASDLYAAQHDVARSLLALTDVDRRYTTDLMKPDGGTKRMKKPGGKGGMVVGGKEVLVERDAPYGMFFGLRKGTFLRLTWPNTGWADKGGGVLKWVDGYAEYSAFWHLFENYHNVAPSKNFRLEGITTNGVVAKSF
jgi:hypothetical protein